MTVNDQDYKVLKMLGKGKGGYSYLVCKDSKQYVLKQIHHEPCDYYQFGDKLASELRDYDRLNMLGIPMPLKLAVDYEQERILKTFIDGPTIYELVLRDSLKDSYVQQLEEMCRVLYSNGLNIDYFPTNFVVEGGKVYYIDYECNHYDSQWNFENWGRQYWYKSPKFMEYAASRGDL